MRIAVICESFSALSETFIYDYVVALKSTGIHVDIITLNLLNTSERPFDNVHNVYSPGRLHLGKLAADFNPIWLGQRLVRRLRGGTTSVPGYQIYQQIYQHRIKSILSGLHPDVVHAEFGPMGVLVRPVAKSLRLPLVVSFHGHDASRLLRSQHWRDRYRMLFKTIRSAVCPSHFIREQLLNIGAPAEKIHVIHNGINLDRIPYSAPTNRYDGKTVQFVFVGRFVPKKDPVSLIKAFARCQQILGRQPGVALTLAGDGPLLEFSRSLTHDLGLTHSVKFTGPLPHSEVLQLLQNSHIYVQCSTTTEDGETEGLPVSIAEAAASGLPVISTIHSGIPELIISEENGFLVNEGDTEGMAEIMAQLAKKPSKWNTLGLAGRHRIEQQFEISNVTAKMRQVLTNAAAMDQDERH